MSDADSRLVLPVGAATSTEFLRVPLTFKDGTYTNVFAQKNNKTLKQTFAHRRYSGLEKPVMPEPDCASWQTMPLGSFVLHLKGKGDDRYRRFLNKYGDLTYSTFAIGDERSLSEKGIYAYRVGEELKYIGRCRDSMRKQVNQGYGKIHPKNCYIDGQATNCHLNALITQTRDQISLWLCPMTSDAEIEVTELALLRRYSPPWNIQCPW